MGNLTDKDSLIEALLQERDELYLELSSLREKGQGSLEQAEKKNERYEAIIKEKDDKIKHLTDQLANNKKLVLSETTMDSN